MPTNDLPLPDKWKQLTPQRADRINDIPEAKHNEVTQQALRKANDEAKSDDALATKAGNDESSSSSSKSKVAQDKPEEVFNLDDDYKFDSEVEEDTDEQIKAKSSKRLAQATEQPMAKKAKTEATGEPEPTTQSELSAASAESQGRPKRERGPKQTQQSSEYEKIYTTGPGTRAERLKQRALRAGRDEVGIFIGWVAIAPAVNKQSPNSRNSQQRKERERVRLDRQRLFERGQVTPEGARSLR